MQIPEMIPTHIPLRVLIVEDSEDDAFFIIRTLEREGYVVSYQRVDLPAQMRQAFERQTWDIVISDYQMPAFDGLAALKIYKEFNLDIPFIVVSGAIGEETAVKVMKAGAHDYLIKDNLTRLVPAIRRELHEAKLRQERSAALLALQRSESRYRAIVEDQTELIYRCMLDGTITYANQTCSQLHGKSPWELINKKYAHTLLTQEVARLKEVQKRLSPTEPVVTSETSYQLLDGQTIWIQWRDHLIVDEHGKPFEYQGVGRDITEQKRTEEELREFATNLERRAVQLQVAAEIARDATSIQVIDDLLNRAVDLASKRFGFYHVAVFLTDEKNSYAVMTVASSETGRQLVAAGHKLKIGEEGIVGYVTATGQPRIALDVGVDSVFYLQPMLPKTCSEMALPLKVGNQIIGALDVQSENANAFDSEDLQIFQTMADQLAIAIDNLRLLSEVQQRAQELEGLYSAALVTSSELEVEALLGRFYEQVQRFINPDSFTLAFYNEKQQEIMIVLAMESGNPIPAFQNLQVPLAAGGLSGHIIRTRKSLRVNDVEMDPLPVDPIRDPDEKHLTRAWLGVPLILRDKILGVVAVQSFRAGAFDANHQRFLESLAAQVAIAFENANLFEAEKLAREQAETLSEIGRIISGSLEVDQVLSRIFIQIKRVVRFDTASVILFDENQEFDLVSGQGFENEQIVRKSAGQVLKDSLILRAMSETLQPMIIPDVYQEPRWIWVTGAEHVHSFLGVPVITRQTMVGALMLDSVQKNAFTQDDARVIQAVAQQIAIALETARLFEAERAQLLLARTLQEAGMLLTSQLGLREVLDKILDLLGRVIQYDSVSVQLLEDEQQLYYAAGRGFENLAEIDRKVRGLSKDNLRRQARYGNQAIVIADTTLQEDWVSVTGLDAIRSWICAPLQSRGKLIGLLTVDSHTPNAFSAEVANTVMAFANQAAIAIDNAQLFDAERSARQRAEALRKASQAINSTLSLDQVIREVLEQISSVLQYDSGSVILIEGHRAYVQAGFGYGKPPEWPDITQVEYDLSLKTIEHILKTRQPLMIMDVLDDPRWLRTAYTAHVRSWMGIPLQVREQVVGIINLERKTPGGFSADELSLAQAFATHTSTAIENARLFETEEKRARELEALRKVNLSLTASLEPDSVLSAILKGVETLMPEAWHSHIFLCKDDEFIFGAEYWADEECKLNLSALAKSEVIPQVAALGQVVVEPNFKLNRLFDDLDKEDFRGALISLPLKTGERIVGTLDVVYIDSQTFLPTQLRVLNLLADQAALAIENAHLFQQTIMERRHISLLYDLGRAIAVSLQPEVILKAALDLTCQALNGHYGIAWLPVPEKKKLHLQAFYAKSGKDIREIVSEDQVDIDIQSGVTGWVAEHRTPANITNLEADPRWVPVTGVEIQSLIAAPILEGEILLGVIAVYNQDVAAFDTNQLNLLQAICQQISLALSNARRYQDVDRLVSLLAIEQYRLEGLIEMLPVGVLLIDAQQNLLVTNSLAREALTELAPDEIGLTISRLGPYSVSQILAQSRNLLPTEIILGGLHYKIYEIQAQPLETDLPQWVITLRDVTQEREIQERIQMQERLATVGQLAAGIAHDFNNIMAAIVVYADLLLMDSTISASSRERLSIIQQQVQRAASLIRQILDFSRRSVMEQSTLDLLPFMKELEKLLNRTLPETISVDLKYEEAEYILSADPTRLQQVFMNLAVNARDAMPAGGKLSFHLSRLQVQAHQDPPLPDMLPGNWLVISVSDTGTGIPLEDQLHIFEPFFTTKPVGQGTGLGLAQVYGIVKQHGGYIDLKSRVGEGAQFIIYLPAQIPSTTKVSLATLSPELDGDGQTVLLVEDDHATRKALEAMLKFHNYRVRAAENGLRALEMLEQDAGAIVLVVSDVVMPQMGGLQLYEHIAARWPHIQMLFITGHPLDEKNQQILEQGKVHWLQKPFTVQEFNQTLLELQS